MRYAICWTIYVLALTDFFLSPYSHTPLKIIPSITLKEKVYPKFKTSGSDEGNFHKNLLLCMVRLIHADPMLMLNSQGDYPNFFRL